MYAQIFSATVQGIDGLIVTVEVDIANGLPQFELVGLGGSAVKEARDRVRAALRNGGFDFPLQRITVNLAPADLRKEGSGFDLAIAMGILLASEQVRQRTEQTLILGELALDGSLRPMSGVLPILLEAKQKGFTHVILPQQNTAEARLVDLTIMPADTLKTAVQYWTGEKAPPSHFAEESLSVASSTQQRAKGRWDFAHVLGQQSVKRGLEVAAAGFHNVLLIGPPGSGKTLLAHCLPTIMPQMSREESYDVTKIYSIAGQLRTNSGLIEERPFRAPHHTITAAALVGGGGQVPRPGECSLAHGGILFLDELPEFSRHVLEVLRQPLEAGCVTIGRSRQVYTFPARFLLIASLNPCPCGFYGTYDEQRLCTCTPQQIQKYRARLSGPLLDRIDIHLEVPRVPVEELELRKTAEPSQLIRQRVEQARKTQEARFAERLSFPFNSGMQGDELRKHVNLDKEGAQLLRLAFHKMGLSARGYDRVLKVARTIADLDHSEQVLAVHIAEAVKYRSLDRAVPG
ncbi:YifB family Mg chelatase-like AAA ATPase [Brevibacillus fulvus]|uniref:Magnesium chelatase family protein n=1 Tax=Brevibacillus fulvus TaxID=1125967 RepID=A0A938Y0T6_9BACL|nr:YifB family Mg chelatase-like AAA ATPase [Brevibacillus fulvus]MBM7589497.1 magnesium chelatase family protein [Brevibacillus fulvus]